jgi:NADPH:quinone reductase-like Zn-dependent oxidoreductase
MEYAGVVVAMGPLAKAAKGAKNDKNPQNLKVGDRVCGLQDIAMQQNPGTWAEKTVAPASHAVKIPESLSDLSFVQAAAVCMGAFVCGDLARRAGIPQLVSRSIKFLINETILISEFLDNNNNNANGNSEHQLHAQMLLQIVCITRCISISWM